MPLRIAVVGSWEYLDNPSVTLLVPPPFTQWRLGRSKPLPYGVDVSKPCCNNRAVGDVSPYMRTSNGRPYGLQKLYRVVSKVGIYGICPYGLLLLDRGRIWTIPPSRYSCHLPLHKGGSGGYGILPYGCAGCFLV